MALNEQQATRILDQNTSEMARIDAELRRLDKYEIQNDLTDQQLDELDTQKQTLRNQRSHLADQAKEAFMVVNPDSRTDAPAIASYNNVAIGKVGDQSKAKFSKEALDDDLDDWRTKQDTGAPQVKQVYRRDTSVETTTGGGTTTIKTLTPEQEAYYKQKLDAEELDRQQTQANKEAYLRSQGLESATPAQKRKILRDAEANGTNFESTKNQDALGKAPAGSPTIIKTDPVQQTEISDKVSQNLQRDAASSQTAADAQGLNPNSDFTGTNAGSNLTAQPIEADEILNLTEAEDLNSDFDNNQPPTTPPTPGPVETTDETSGTGEESPVKILPNQLHNYASYTYGITLHLLTKDSFNSMADGGEWLPDAKTLISSAGRYGKDPNNPKRFVRAPYFAEDFYFDNFNLETVIGLNSNTKGTNAIEMSFTLIEPYGLTLINRLLTLSIELGMPNYLENPYVLQLDFFGNDDAGLPLNPIPNITKFFPIRIIEMGIKVNTGGAVYSCRATPYNHTAFLENIAATPMDMELNAKTVKDFFLNDADDKALSQQIVSKQNQREVLDEYNRLRSIGELSQAQEQQFAIIEKSYKQAYNVKSYAAAYNAQQEFLKQTGAQEYASKIIFNIDPKIGNSNMVYPKKTAVQNVPMTARNKEGTNQAQSANAPAKNNSTPAAGPQTEFEKFNVKAGESVINVINNALRNSQYITDQIKDEKQQDKDKIPINWFKVIPRIKLLEFDRKKNKWATETVFNIVQFKYHNTKYPLAPISSEEEILKNLRKRYDYIYTGKNNDIIEFAIDFNTLFFTVVDVFTQNTSSLSNAEDNPDIDKNKKVSDLPINQTNQVVPRQAEPVTANQASQSGFNAYENPAIKRAGDIMSSIYSKPRGDMLNVNLRIIGDPDFIKQDDLYLNPANSNYPAEGETQSPDGSILTDRGDIFVLINWRTPADYNQETGLTNTEEKYLESNFSGVFRVLTVKSEFKGGKFEQTLDCVRLNDENVDVKKATALSERNNGIKASPIENQNFLNNQTEYNNVPNDFVEPEGLNESYSNTQLASLQNPVIEEDIPFNQNDVNLETIVDTGSVIPSDAALITAENASTAGYTNTAIAPAGSVNIQPAPTIQQESDIARQRPAETFRQVEIALAEWNEAKAELAVAQRRVERLQALSPGEVDTNTLNQALERLRIAQANEAVAKQKYEAALKADEAAQ